MYKLTKPQKLIYDMERFVGDAVAVVCGSAIRDGYQDIAKLKATVNALYRLNDALRTRIVEQNGEIKQTIVDFTEQDIEELYFANKAELDKYAENYTKQPINISGNLCEVKVVQLPEQYGFIIKVHHIIGDAWTLSLFASQFYAILDGETPVAYPYKEYADSEVAYLQSKRYEKDSAFFLEQFKKCDEITYLSDKQTNSLISVRKTFEINREKSRYIYNYAQEHHTSPFTLFATALSVYINRVKMNAEKFYIGTAILNRSGVREKNTMGMFINTVPMLIELNNEQTFLQNLTSVETSAFLALRHQKYNYGDVLEDIRKKYNFNRRLYDVIISYQNAKITGNAESTWYHNGVQVESLQIHIDDRDSDEFFKFQYDYQIEKFTEQDIERLHQNICNLLFDAIANDSRKLYELELLSSDERQKLLIDFNDTVVDYPKDKCVHTLFEEQVMKTPDKTAVIACDRTLTYDELNKQANRIAHKLIAKNIGRGDIVAIKLTRKSYLISAMLGVLKTAAAYMPLDPTYPQERIEYMLHESNAKYAIGEENISELLKNENDNNPNIYVSHDDVFCALHTSGSTGEPKLSLLLHGGICNYLASSQGFYKNADTFVSSTITTFDAFQWESVLSISKGITLVLSSEDAIYNQANFEKLFSHSNRNMFFCPPAKLENYINNSIDIKFLSNIKSFIIGGEVFIDTLLEKIRTHSPDSTIFNAYGPTETTVICIKREVHAKGEETTLGKPIANIQIYIVDKYLKPVPIGVTGELCIAGNGVGAGYLNRPELTAEKFIDNPFGKGKLYRTGDLAYWRDDGNIVYVGRNDFQVKIRGLRIELGEIENAISAIDGIVQSVVIVRKDNTGRQIICAFYTGKEFTAKEIREIIGQKLPKYMLPHIFTHLEKMPLTPSGKISRKSLPDVDLSQIITTTEYVEPENELEIRLAALMEKVLEYSPIGRDDDFFELGGDSLKAINLISNLEKIGYHTDIKTLFANPTVRTLVTKLTPATQQIVTIEEIKGEVPATHAQMRVYAAQTIQGGTAYNVPFVFRVDTLNPEKLQKAIQALVDRYEIFRTHFEEQNGRTVQIVEQKIVFNVEKLENDDISAFIRPFDLSKTPLLRVGYYENTIMIDIHHIIIDGGSFPIFFRELNELYMGRELKAPIVQYRQIAAQPRDYSYSEDYWLNVYADEIPELELNTDYKRKNKLNYNGTALYASLDLELHQNIINVSRKIRITPFIFYMGAFYILLSKFSGNEDIIVGIPVNGRKGTNLDVIGMFVNTVALRGKPIGTRQISEFLTEGRYKTFDAIINQDYPYGELIKKLNINTPNRNPLFDVMFAYQDKAISKVVLADKSTEVLPIPITTSKYDFTFNIIPQQDNVVIMAEYCTDLYKGNTIQRFIDGYRLILEQMLDSDKLIKDISVMNEQERQKLLIDFNNTTVDYPRDKCVHTLFEEQVIKTPNKAAVIACDKTLTYDELNKQANRIAHKLIAKNIGRGDIVAIKLTRKSYLISAMLGVLKTAAAYMPLDPTYPQERIEYMLHESNAKYAIGEENISELLKNENDNNPNIYVSHDDVFCALHTSGSTGEPKLSLLLHGGMNNFIIASKRFWNRIDTVVSTTIVTFDAFQMDTILSVAQGVQLVLSDENEIYSQNDFEKLFLYSKSNMFFSTPTKIENYIDNSINFSYLDRIKSFIIGGEIFNESLLNRIMSHSLESSIFNIYGPTETTICVLVDSLDKTTKEITLGKPISNTKIYIIDKYLKPVPIGVTGELCIAGDGVGAGYLNRPELTAEKFIDNPFGKGKLYRTGDLAYWRDDGNIVYVGRNDFQVKIRGLRIELGEIENAISAIDGIVQSVVIVRKDNTGRQIICAFYTGKEFTAKEIREIIGQKLPKYMLPHIFTHLEKMPLTPSGKISRKSLPDVDLSQIITTTEYVEPENELEIRLAALMEKVLEYSPIGRNDDFFELGFDSLKAIMFTSIAHNDGINFNLQNVFDYPTIRLLAEYINDENKQQISYANFDFTEINKILTKNTIENIQTPQAVSVGNILLTGATGFLGSHILSDYLECDSGIAYCLVRGKNQAESERRLTEILEFYFGKKYNDCERIQVICADLQDERFGLTELGYKNLSSCVNTVINAAATVKHYGSYSYFHSVNVETVTRLIDFCVSSDAKLIHISTESVSGNDSVEDFIRYDNVRSKIFYASDLYIGQNLENVYALSKFEAEIAVLKTMNKGLRANIMRMGNLTNRYSDGVFQINYETNAFLKRFKAFLGLGMIPDYLLGRYVEFTPIDEAAHAVMTITRHFSNEQTVFHIENYKRLLLDNLIVILKKLGYEVAIMEGAVFTKALLQTIKQKEIKYIFEAFINDMDTNNRLAFSNLHIDTDFTVQYLKSLGFEWSKIDLEYLKKYMEYFRKKGYWKT